MTQLATRSGAGVPPALLAKPAQACRLKGEAGWRRLAGGTPAPLEFSI